MSSPGSAPLRSGREQLVRLAAQLAGHGLVIGSAGNLSTRVGDLVLITPSGVAYDELAPGDICEIRLASAAPDVPTAASSETPMHLAIYRTTGAGAVVHTHSPEVIAVSATLDELPAVHYAITDLGGPVRVAPYHRFGSDELARQAVAAMSGRTAVILQNHGAVTIGDTLGRAYERARLLEWLAHVYRLACSLGTPRILTQAELDEVTAHARRIRYGADAPPAGNAT